MLTINFHRPSISMFKNLNLVLLIHVHLHSLLHLSLPVVVPIQRIGS